MTTMKRDRWNRGSPACLFLYLLYISVLSTWGKLKMYLIFTLYHMRTFLYICLLFYLYLSTCNSLPVLRAIVIHTTFEIYLRQFQNKASTHRKHLCFLCSCTVLYTSDNKLMIRPGVLPLLNTRYHESRTIMNISCNIQDTSLLYTLAFFC
jgi:hypothetical protein